MSKDLAIDLGSANTRIYKKGEGIIIKEPSVIAYQEHTQEVLHIGDEALQMIGRTPENVKTIRPLREGAISDFDITQRLLRILFKKSRIGRFSRPKVLVCVPSAITSVERRAIIGATYGAGASEVHLINQSIAAALHCGQEIHKPKGNMVVDVGAGTTEAIIISLNQVVSSSAAKLGSFKLDEAIQKYVRDIYGVGLSEGTAEKIKIVLGSAVGGLVKTKGEVKGLDLTTSKPKSITLEPLEIQKALDLRVREIIETIAACLIKAPPELNRDILARGIFMVGGGSLLTGLAQSISEAVNVPIHIVPSTMECVIYGAGKCLESLEQNQQFLRN